VDIKLYRQLLLAKENNRSAIDYMMLEQMVIIRINYMIYIANKIDPYGLVTKCAFSSHSSQKC